MLRAEAEAEAADADAHSLVLGAKGDDTGNLLMGSRES